MLKYEYKVVPAPSRGMKGKGVKGPQAMFAHALATLMNEMGAEGWEYQRAETLPSEERRGLTGRVTNMRHVLVFRRELLEPVEHAMLPPLGAGESDGFERREGSGAPALGPARGGRGGSDLAAE